MAEEPRSEETPPILEGEYVETGKAARKRRLGWVPWALLVLFAAFVGGIFAAPYAEPQLRALGLLPPAPEPARAADAGGQEASVALRDTLARLEGRLGALEAAVGQISRESEAVVERLETLARQGETAPAEGGASEAALGRIEDRLDAVADRLADLERQTAAAAGAVSTEEIETLTRAVEASAAQRERLSGRIETLSRRIAALEALGRGSERRAPALMSDLFTLARTLDSGAGYAAALRQLEQRLAALPEAARVGAEPALAALRPHAEAGIPARAQLAERFAALAPAIQRAAPAPEEAGFFGRLGHRLASIVVVRPKEAGAGDGVADRLARAEAALERGDLAGALAEVAALPDAARAPAADWLADARARLEAERALRALLAIAGAPAAPSSDDSS